jgi:hypothetical protein
MHHLLMRYDLILAGAADYFELASTRAARRDSI